MPSNQKKLESLIDNFSEENLINFLKNKIKNLTNKEKPIKFDSTAQHSTAQHSNSVLLIN
ncbi:MAG: hypothetical protein CSA45_05430 [Gammaproteobacteria bacterium]|nr:MAG: hypothetical protein CSA45_05430 [Gammaproteobacteria bacterium]